MKTFKSLAQVDEANLPPPLHQTCRSTLEALVGAYVEVGAEYDPEEDGYVVLVEKVDTDADLERETGSYSLRTALFEGCIHENGVFLTCVLHNNQFGISIVVPDAPWLPVDVRARLMAEVS